MLRVLELPADLCGNDRVHEKIRAEGGATDLTTGPAEPLRITSKHIDQYIGID